LSSDTLDQLLDLLDESKRRFDPQGSAQTSKGLAQIQRRRFTDAETLIRFHEILLFIRAYPQNARILRLVEKILSSFVKRVHALSEMEADLSPLDDVEVSGIAGTWIEETFTYSIARWLDKKYPTKLSIDWEAPHDEYRLAATLPRLLPLLEEDALVEANVPYIKWISTAKGRQPRDLSWILAGFERLQLSEKEKAELYESLKLLVWWELGNSRATRTMMKRPTRNVFYHTGPLLRRSDVSLEREFASAPIELTRLSRSQGEAILDLARETSSVRYRELYGFTHGDASRVLRADIGRGVEVFITGVPPERRLPLRAYHAGPVFKNGVPVCYVECLSFFERIEVGFNVYYTFREGESAWIYARVLKIFRQLLKVSVFSIDPYQLGYENEEGIESGAFWFYRKLGFRPTVPRLTELMRTEELRLATRPGYRTPPRILRQLAQGHMLLEIPPADRGRWDNFQIRNVALAVQRKMARRFKGEAEKIRQASVESVARALNVNRMDLKQAERAAFADHALVLALIPDLSSWSRDEKQAVVEIIRAKAGADEARYVRLLVGHPRLRDEVIRIGS
jgi:hypothetical protein